MNQNFIDRDPDLTPEEQEQVERAKAQRNQFAMMEAMLAAEDQLAALARRSQSRKAA